MLHHIARASIDAKLLPRLMALALTLALAPVAWAHKLNVFIYVEGKTVHVEGYFADGAKAKNSDVTAVNAAQEIVAAGKTDEDGEYSFGVNAAADLRIVLNAGLGHQTEYLLAASEFGDSALATAAPATAAADGTDAGVPSTSGEVPAPIASGAAAAGPSAQEMQAAVHKAVTDAIKPLAREIDALKNKTNLQDIVGGFGFIIGAFGIWAYLKARQTKPRAP